MASLQALGELAAGSKMRDPSNVLLAPSLALLQIA
jgi:hypothetical protein